MQDIQIRIKGYKQKELQEAINNLPIDKKETFFNILSDITEEIIKRRNSGKRRTTKFYDRFPSYSKEEVDYVLTRIGKEKVLFLQKCYGEDLTSDLTPNLTEEERQELEKIIRYIKARANHYKKHGKPRKAFKVTRFYDRFSSYSKEEVDYVLTRIGKEKVLFLQKCYGEDLTNELNPNLEEEEIQELEKIIRHIKAMIHYYKNHDKSKKKPKNNGLTGLYARFLSYSKEDIDYAISRRSKEEIMFLQKCYGEDLTSELNPNLTEEEQEKLAKLIGKLKSCLSSYRERGKPKTDRRIYMSSGFYKNFRVYSKENIDCATSRRRKEEIIFLQKCYGEDLTNDLNPNLTEEELLELKKIINNIRKMVSEYEKKGRPEREAKNNGLTGFYSKFPSYSKEEIDYAVSRSNK